MTDTPNTDLLLRQRTFSIDETREQMQQGRPVQREAIIAGEVDVGSLFYGEDTAAPAGPGKSAGLTQQQTQKKKTSSIGGSWAGVLMKGGEAPPPPAHPTPSPQKRPEAPKASTGPAGGSAAGGSSGGSSDKKGSTGAGGEGGKRRDNRREVRGVVCARWSVVLCGLVVMGVVCRSLLARVTKRKRGAVDMPTPTPMDGTEGTDRIAR